MDAGVKTKKPGGHSERLRKGESGASAAIKAVGIIGAGQMGNGIAHVVALAGYDVALHDITGPALEAVVTGMDGPALSDDPVSIDVIVVLAEHHDLAPTRELEHAISPCEPLVAARKRLVRG